MGDASYVVIQFLQIRIGVFIPEDVNWQFKQSQNDILKSMRSIREAEGNTSDHIISREDNNEEEEMMGGESS